MKYILALDEGTTGVTAMVFADDGTVCSRVNREFRQYYPQPGWVEHDAEEIWQVALGVGREALGLAAVTGSDLSAIGITNQRETLVAWDRVTGDPLHRAIVWQDRRTTPLCQQMKSDGLEPQIRQKTGLLLDPYFTASKLKWLLDAQPEFRASAHVGTIDSWLVHRLTCGRVHATDVSNASRTLLCNLSSGQWDEELLTLFEVPRDLLPDIRPSSGSFGEADARWFGAEVPILGVAGDQQAALYGHGAHAPGKVKNTYGTGSFLLMNTGEDCIAAPEGLLSTIAWQREGGEIQYALEGSVFVTGAAVQWLRDGLEIISSASETEALARSVPSSEGLHFVPALTGLGSPYWDPDARGMICGITRGTSRAHLVRATLEAIALQTVDVARCMTAASKLELKLLHADGGATGNAFLMQEQADLLQTTVQVSHIPETTALGAACLAAHAAGIPLPDASNGNGPVFHPQMEPHLCDARLQAWQNAVARCRMA